MNNLIQAVKRRFVETVSSERGSADLISVMVASIVGTLLMLSMVMGLKTVTDTSIKLGNELQLNEQAQSNALTLKGMASVVNNAQKRTDGGKKPTVTRTSGGGIRITSAFKADSSECSLTQDYAFGYTPQQQPAVVVTSTPSGEADACRNASVLTWQKTITINQNLGQIESFVLTSPEGFRISDNSDDGLAWDLDTAGITPVDTQSAPELGSVQIKSVRDGQQIFTDVQNV